MFSKTDGKGNEYISTNNKILAGFLQAVEKPRVSLLYSQCFEGECFYTLLKNKKWPAKLASHREHIYKNLTEFQPLHLLLSI